MHPNIQKSAPKDQYLCDFMIWYLLWFNWFNYNAFLRKRKHYRERFQVDRYFLWCLWRFKIGSCYPLGTAGLSEPEKGLWISWFIGGVAMSRNIRVSEPSAEMQIKIIRAKDAIASQKPRIVRCPYCRHNSIIVFEDTRGHVQTKCKACGRETVFNVLEMRRLRRLQCYYSSLNGWDDNK